MSESPNDFTPTPNSTEATPQKANSPTVVVIILAGLGCGCLGLIGLGIVAAIALPSFLNSAGKAKEAEARTYVGSMLRGEQAFYLEKEKFSTTIEDLGLGIQSETKNYSYKITPAEKGKGVLVYANPKDKRLKGFSGAVYAVGNNPASATTYSGLCKSSDLGKVPNPPTLNANLTSPEIVCPVGSTSMAK